MRNFFVSALSAMLVLASCQKNEILIPKSGNTLTATIEKVTDTRTMMDENKNVLWTEGDQVIAFMKSTLGTKFQVTEESVGETTADFDEVLSGGGGLHSGNELSHNVVYYPYASSVKCKMTSDYYSLSVNLPSEQHLESGSFGIGSFPMVAVSETNNITFRNVCGAVKLQLKGTQNVISVKIEGKAGEKLSGDATVTAYSDGTRPSIEMGSSASSFVILNCGSGVQLNENTGKEFVIALPPVDFSEGFTVTVMDSQGCGYIVETSKPNPVKRSGLLVMPPVTLGESDALATVAYIDEYGINHGPGVKIGETIWAPVNCGYHATDFKYGKLYQWGRKYGQGYSNPADDTDMYSDPVLPDMFGYPYTFVESQSEIFANNIFGISNEANDWVNYSCDIFWNLGTEDNPIKSEYDPCPDGWRVPTCSELNDLIANHSSWSLSDGHNGFWFSGQESYEQDATQLFLPAEGFRMTGANCWGRENAGFYWSSTVYKEKAHNLHFNEEKNAYMGFDFRSHSFAVRCVKDDDKLVAVTDISFEQTNEVLITGEELLLEVDITPSNASQKNAYWYSDNPDVATVDQYGNVTAVSPGKTYINAVAGYFSSRCLVMVTDIPREDHYVDEYGINHGPGVKIGETIWAPVNCGYKAATETDRGYPYGKIYQWGRKYGQGYNGSYNEDATYPSVENNTIIRNTAPLAEAQSEAYANVFFIGDPDNGYDWLSPPDDMLWNKGSESNPVKSEYDPCPEGWRVPTSLECEELCTHEFVSQYSPHGHVLTGFGLCLVDADYESSGLPSFFLQANGWCSSDGGASMRNGHANYWTSNPAVHMCFFDHDIKLSLSNNGSRANGHGVRCVRE